MKVLINHSNHPSSKWSDEQKGEWDKIINIPFPEVPPCADTQEVFELVKENYDKICHELSKIKDDVYIYVAGEYTYSYLMFDLLRRKQPQVKIAIPTTERMAIERAKEDGSVEKVSVFMFVRWRVIGC